MNPRNMGQAQVHVRERSLSQDFRSKWDSYCVYYYHFESNRGDSGDEYDK